MADGFITAKVEHQSISVAMETAQAIGTFVGYEIDGIAKDISLGSKPNQELPEETGHQEAKAREQKKVQEQKQQKIPAKPWQAAMLTNADLNGFDEATSKDLGLPDSDTDEFGSSTSQTHYTATHAANKVQASHGARAAQMQSRAHKYNSDGIDYSHETKKQFALSSAEKIAEKAQELHGGYLESSEKYLKEGLELSEKSKALENNWLSWKEAKELYSQRQLGAEDLKLASRYGFFSKATNVLT